MLRVVPLDALTAIYHRPSGQTHVVDEAVPAIIAVLQAGNSTIDDLAVRMKLDAGERPALAARLDELVRAGLAERR